MKICSIFTAIAVASAASAGLAETGRAEIGYERGSLGFEALVANNNEEALRQLLAERSSVARNDPARLINLGHAYTRLGDVEKARQAFEAAANCKEEFDLVLSDGSVINSRKAARLALKKLDER